MPASNGHALRRSSRVPIQVPIHVASLEPNTHFSEVCETLVVNAHGCALRFPIKLNTGSPLLLHTQEGREATARVVACQPMGADGQGWRLGAMLDQPENLWGLKSYPDDWRVVEMPLPGAQKTAKKQPTGSVVWNRPQASSISAQAILDKVEQQLSEDRLQGLLAKLVRPLQTELTELQDKVARNARQNRFEVSLGQIPPELEEKLWERLRQDLGARVLQQTREQSAEILASAKTATEQKIGAALTEFRHRLSGELHAVEQQAQALSKELTAMARQQVQAGIENLQQQTLAAGAHLGAQGEKLLGSLQRGLEESHRIHRQEVEKIQADATVKTAELQSGVLDLGRRVAMLNESVRSLESDLEAHLESIVGEIVRSGQTQLESSVGLALKDFQVRGSNEVEARLAEACGNLRTIQNRIEKSFSGSLTDQSEDTVQSVGQQFEELTQRSMERWRLALAKDLNSVAETLGQQLRREVDPNTSQN